MKSAEQPQHSKEEKAKEEADSGLVSGIFKDPETSLRDTKLFINALAEDSFQWLIENEQRAKNSVDAINQLKQSREKLMMAKSKEPSIQDLSTTDFVMESLMLFLAVSRGVALFAVNRSLNKKQRDVAAYQKFERAFKTVKQVQDFKSQEFSELHRSLYERIGAVYQSVALDKDGKLSKEFVNKLKVHNNYENLSEDEQRAFDTKFLKEVERDVKRLDELGAHFEKTSQLFTGRSFEQFISAQAGISEHILKSKEREAAKEREHERGRSNERGH